MSDQTDNAMDPNSLYREENFTDQKLGAIRKLIPVNSDGSDDKDREVMFFGSAQVMTPMGALPLNFALEGSTIGAAAEDFAGKAAIILHLKGPRLEPQQKILQVRQLSQLKRLQKSLKICAESRLLRLWFQVKAEEWEDLDKAE